MNNNANLSSVKVGYLNEYLKGQKILDVGAGQCYYSNFLFENKPELKITAVDLMDRPETNGFEYIKLDLEKPMPFEDSVFDSILAFDIIEHISNEKQILSELARVCCKDGLIIGSVPHDKDDFLPNYNLTFYHRSDLTHKRYYIKETLKSSLNSVGFDMNVVEPLGGVSPQVIAEFFPSKLRFLVKKAIGALRRIGVVRTDVLRSDLFFVAVKR